MSGTEPVPGSVVVVGERERVEGYGLAGASVVVADGPDDVRAALRDLPSETVLVVLTRAAAAALDPALGPDDPGPGSTMDRQVVVLP
ncbi:hypothetical protein [Virgisporangium ochraceum]|uniref:Uncharacterized protein n=1 Tax=Virgisporangium ochraceum TaxID=65505 RepID=A0A8J4A1H9_9ACTN|nr:hypothetical protein [Virgisporangium ochraceum]GIJ71540.1 hypothetical protein Voc01_064570 [Virgisporangium ochraceum]